ncbi:MAG: hypothetical protein M1828_003602 [Chrysothrix sp. TS-e1954]|nr:MAG: hypothetical protein M1828_003602 [Chrysothrix sp. TS-e1954]
MARRGEYYSRGRWVTRSSSTVGSRPQSPSSRAPPTQPVPGAVSEVSAVTHTVPAVAPTTTDHRATAGMHPYNPRSSDKRAVTCNSAIATVVVGSGEGAHHFSIHKLLLTTKSRYFHNALLGPFEEAKSDTVRLVDDNPSVFWVYYQWLYVRRILSPQVDSPDVHSAQNKLLIAAYIFGDKIQDDDFCDTVIDALISLKTTPVCDQTYSMFCHSKFIYENLPEGSPLRRFATDKVLYQGNAGVVPTNVDDCNKESLHDLVLSWLRKKGTPLTSNNAPYYGTDPCFYHKHGKDRPCYREAENEQLIKNEPLQTTSKKV